MNSIIIYITTGVTYMHIFKCFQLFGKCMCSTLQSDIRYGSSTMCESYFYESANCWAFAVGEMSCCQEVWRVCIRLSVSVGEVFRVILRTQRGAIPFRNYVLHIFVKCLTFCQLLNLDDEVSNGISNAKVLLPPDILEGKTFLKIRLIGRVVYQDN